MRLILIDSPNSAGCASQLADWDFDVVREHDVTSAAALLAGSKEAAVILVDACSAGDAALAAAGSLRTHCKWPERVLVAVLPAEREAELAGAAVAAGFDDYWVAPLRREAIDLRLAGYRRARQLHVEFQDVREHLRYVAMHDPLTGAWNKAGLVGHLYREVARAVRDRGSLSMLMCDIDHFKRVNDQHGHRAGDEVLCAVARRLGRELRPYDVVARFGGDELGVILVGCGAEEAATIARRVVKCVADAPFATSAGDVRVTASVGVATLVDVPLDLVTRGPDALLEAADEALYRAKAAGRDRAVVARRAS
jgi:two-component system, cell cycle response regulator